MLEKQTGRPRQVSPRDATVRRHFYSLDADGGKDSAVEDLIAVVESEAAPLIAGLDEARFPVGAERLTLAMFIAMCWLRTPASREQNASVGEQMVAALVAESYRLDPRIAQRAFADSEWDMTPKEIEEFRIQFVDDLRNGRLTIKFPKNMLVKDFLQGALHVSWIIFLLDWSLVRLEKDAEEFILADTPVSLFDPTPAFPGGGGGVLSSPNAQMFLPMGPRLGLLLESSKEIWTWARENLEDIVKMNDEETAAALSGLEGRWGEGTAAPEFARELNLRSYATAERFIFGSQKAAQDVHAARRQHKKRLAELTPRGPRMHLVEDDPASPTGLRIAETFQPQRRE